MKSKALFLSLLGAVAAFGMPANAQVISNQPSTVVNSSSPFGHIILGGAARQQNLFHSFSEFDTSSGQFVNFVVNPNVVNVISRVTGAPTAINGLVTVTSAISGGNSLAPGVNLFLLSPRGLSFGTNALRIKD
ncbi:MAG: hypothetical protein DCF25_12040 [Leptolyngbya foveolarum]|uniref:Filamentous haemagglutinin FhaB/tRNA nuclease CdiA-like TPS domain-containing protein n=1 Tax=Leptolyngbya foveolarum TaxID=47253 RepID=A0A2W4U9K3_9CYAN|nr:MAG: hypothetical protein DCF25_12040 [Leptolyngbya foveolarum]